MIKYHSMESDFWALGVLLYEMLFEITPFYDEDKELAKQKIIEGRFQVPEGVSKVTRDFICNLLNVCVIIKIRNRLARKKIRLLGSSSN